MRNNKILWLQILIFFLLSEVFFISPGYVAQEDGRRIFEASADSIVRILTETISGERFSGTGFVVDENGTIVTAFHVVSNAKSISVRLRSGEIYDVAYIVNFDQRKDLALLKVPAVNLKPLKIADSDGVAPGDRIIAITNPEGLEHTYAEGEVSSIRLVERMGMKVIQTSVPLSHGSSGGPLMNTNGEAISVVSFKRIEGDDLNFGIPINYVRGLLQIDRKIPLEEFKRKVASLNLTVTDDFDAIARTTISGKWYSITSGKTYILREIEDSIYLEPIASQDSKSTSRISGQLHRTDEGYEGEIIHQFTCTYGGTWISQREKFCKLPLGIKILKASPSRIEGRAETIPSGTTIFSRDCKNCGSRIKLIWEDFVWIRPG